jgi:phospholipid-translocating ATPase
LQHHVRQTLETLGNAGIKVWMLTGDKIETAKCIAVSAKLVNRSQTIHTVSIKTETEAAQQLQSFSYLRDACLLIDGTSLQAIFS